MILSITGEEEFQGTRKPLGDSANIKKKLEFVKPVLLKGRGIVLKQ